MLGSKIHTKPHTGFILINMFSQKASRDKREILLNNFLKIYPSWPDHISLLDLRDSCKPFRVMLGQDDPLWHPICLSVPPPAQKGSFLLRK